MRRLVHWAGCMGEAGLANVGYLPMLTWANPHMICQEFQAQMLLFGDNPPANNTSLMELSGDPADMGKFRTPSLCNAAVTAPFFHDGSAETLAEMLNHYRAGWRNFAHGPHAGNGARSPLRDVMIVAKTATDAEIAGIIAFLESPTDPGFLTNPACGDPWPADHPVRSLRVLP